MATDESLVCHTLEGVADTNPISVCPTRIVLFTVHYQECDNRHESVTETISARERSYK